jgi:4-amino-4-deoxy-L-arabinose transferase-like glycosyltransferase
MEQPTLLSILIAWVPFLSWLAVAILILRSFNRYARDQAKYHAALLEQMQQQAKASERLFSELLQQRQDQNRSPQ